MSKRTNKAIPGAKAVVVTAAQPVGRSAPRWFTGKRPIFQFVGIFVVLMGVFYAIARSTYMDKNVLPRYMAFNASASAMILRVLGEDASANGTFVSSPRYAVDIKRGCDAVEPSALFIAAVMAFPTALLPKLPGLLLGTIVLAIINLVRIVTLFYTGIYFPSLFETMHEDVWQALFILLALFLWVVWAWWATATRAARSHVAG